MMVRRKSDTDAEQAVSGSENRGKEWLISFLHSRKGRMTVCGCAAAVLLAVVIIAVLAHNAGDGEPAEKWPTRVQP